MIIGFDLDGTVVDSPQQVVHYINERLGLSLTMDDFKTYSMEDALPQQYKWIVDMAFRDSAMWKKVDIINGAYDIIKTLYEEGHDIYFVTSSLPLNLHKKINHLTRCLDFFPKDYVWRHTINTHHKQMIKLDILVDDALFNLDGDREYYSVCMDMPYNQTDELIPNFTRVKDWTEVYERIKVIESLIKENKNDAIHDH